MSDNPYGTSEHIGAGLGSFFIFGVGGFLVGFVWAHAIGFDWRLGGGIVGGLSALWFGFLGLLMRRDAVHGMMFSIPSIGLLLLIIGGLVWLARIFIFHW